MAVERQAISLDFGIEDNFDTESPEVLDDLFADDIPAATKVTKVKKEEASSTKKETPPAKEEPEEFQISEDDLLDSMDDEDKDDAEENDEDEPKAEDKETAEDDSEESNEDDPEGEANTWKALATDLFKMDILQLGEDEETPEITTPQELKERLILEKKRDAGLMLDNFLSSKGAEYEEAFKAIFIDGIKPEDYYKGQTQIESFRELDLSKEENQKYVIRRSLTQQGFDEEDINDEIERLETYADLEGASRRHHKVLLKDEEKKLAAEREAVVERTNKEKENKKEFQSSVISTLKEKITAKDFDGIPVSKEFAETTLDYITNEKYQTPDGKRLTEWDKLYLELKRPENHQKLVKLAMLAQLVEKDPTLATIKRKVNTDKVNQEFSTLARTKGLLKKPAAKSPNKSPFI